MFIQVLPRLFHCPDILLAQGKLRAISDILKQFAPSTFIISHGQLGQLRGAKGKYSTTYSY